MNSTMPHWITRLGSYRSASAPAQKENNRKGSQCDRIANPPSMGERNFS